jgi:hypothetical protein
VDDLNKPYTPDLIAFTEKGAERLEFVERDVPVVHAERSIDGYVTILRDFDGDFVGFCLEGDPRQWAALKDS